MLSNLPSVMQLASDRARIRFLNEQTPKAVLPAPGDYRVLGQRQPGSGRLMSLHLQEAPLPHFLLTWPSQPLESYHVI